MKPFYLHVKRDASFTGSIVDLDDSGEYLVTVSDGVLSTSWSGTRDTVSEAVALMTRIFVDKLAVG